MQECLRRLLVVVAGGLLVPSVAAEAAPSGVAARAGQAEARFVNVAPGRRATRTVVHRRRTADVALRARLAGCRSARLRVQVDRRSAFAWRLRARGYVSRRLGRLARGSHRLTMSLRGGRAACRAVVDRRLVEVRATARHRGGAGGNPFAGRRLFVDPASDAARQVAAWSSSRPDDAKLIAKLADHADADWFGGWNGDVRADVASRVSQIARAGAYPVLVAYDIPNRDCGAYSAGGAGSPDAYRSWIAQFAAGIGSRPAAVILEPDALAGLDCLSAGDQATRLDLLRFAVQQLTADPHVALYVDAGNAGWHPASAMASRLRAVGVAHARGFSLNVSNFDTTAGEVAYAHRIASALGAGHAVIDTSRNGREPNGAWCNPSDRGLGLPPTAVTGDAVVDAELWIKSPGESDGTCNGGPTAGTWWPDYALGLAQRAAF